MGREKEGRNRGRELLIRRKMLSDGEGKWEGGRNNVRGN